MQLELWGTAEVLELCHVKLPKKVFINSILLLSVLVFDYFDIYVYGNKFFIQILMLFND